MEKRKNTLMLIAIFTLLLGFSGCSTDTEDSEIAMGPTITFANGIKETTTRSGNVSVTIISSSGLKEVVVDQIIDNKVDNVETVMEFANPKSYSFSKDFTVTTKTSIRFTATDRDGRAMDSFVFNPSPLK